MAFSIKKICRYAIVFLSLQGRMDGIENKADVDSRTAHRQTSDEKEHLKLRYKGTDYEEEIRTDTHAIAGSPAGQP